MLEGMEEGCEILRIIEDCRVEVRLRAGQVEVRQRERYQLSPLQFG